MQSAPREGTECYLKQPASARRGTQPPPLLLRRPGVRFRGPVWLPAFGLSWVCSGLVCLCALRASAWAGKCGWTAKRWRSPLNLDPAHQ